MRRGREEVKGVEWRGRYVFVCMSVDFCKMHFNQSSGSLAAIVSY